MYLLVHHPKLSIQKWAKYSKAQQVILIANELNRASNLYEQDMIAEVKNCYERAFELTDMTGEDPKWRGKLKEMRRFRELLAALYCEPNGNAVENNSLYDALIRMIPEAYDMLH
jgi:hypothetical protein